MKSFKKSAIRLILLFGLISLLGDMVYEGARGVNAPYLETLGASAAIVGLVVGLGELLGYLIRLVSGYFSDKTRAHWFFTIFGYSFLMAIPLLSLTGIWQFAAIFMVLERIGKGIRSPAKDTILSQATKQVGTGFGFAIVTDAQIPLLYALAMAVDAVMGLAIGKWYDRIKISLNNEHGGLLLLIILPLLTAPLPLFTLSYHINYINHRGYTLGNCHGNARNHHESRNC